MSEIIKAVPINLIFEANDSLYKVIRATTLEDEDISLVGYFPNIILNLAYEFEGEMSDHPRFGAQFKVKNYKRIDGNTRVGVIEYLIAKCRGVGLKSAEKIFDTLGPNALEIIVDNPNSLKAIKGFGDDKINMIYEDLKNNMAIEKIFVELYGYGLTPIMANKLYTTYGENTLTLIKENPYRLIYEVEGFGFLKSDKLAISLGYKYNDKRRIEEGILFTLNEVCSNNGFCFLTDIQLINSSLKVLNNGLMSDEEISELEITTAIEVLSSKNRIVREDNRLYPAQLFNAEIGVSKKIISLNSSTSKQYDISLISSYIKDVENTFNIEYNLVQKEAIINAVNNKVSIITGGPGTGKTTIIKGLLNILARLEGYQLSDDKFRNKVLLMAPTGRAAKRLGTACGMEASTIHRGLGYNYELEFEYNSENQLPQKLIIVDEFSMVDIMLASNLLDALKDDSKLIIVGDSNQLPSVGSGNVLHDLIESEIIKVTKLKEIMRQSLDSDIIKLSQMVTNQRIDGHIFNNIEKKQLFFYPADIEGAIDRIMMFVDRFIKSGRNLLSDLQILIPMYSGPCGINEINRRIQQRFNTSEEMLVRGEKVFKKYDKVLQLQNNPDLGIMNGDVGFITDIVKGSEYDYLIIDFDGLRVKYPSSELENLTLAYAISIHKSQGSEYDTIIMPILPAYYIMLKRNLIYTGITRAKKTLILIGSIDSLSSAIVKNDDERQTTLTYRLMNKSFQKSSVIYIDNPEIPFDTLGEDNPMGLTPYDFM